MRALITTGYSVTPEVSEIARPEFGPGEVLVKVAAGSVNNIDVMAAAGYLKGILPHTFAAVLGKDFAGTVEAVGTDVQGFAPGDEVFGAVTEPAIGRGTIAEYAVAQPTVGLTHRPAALDTARAGALAIAGSTAHTSIEALALQPGDTVLIVGAAGGVGSLAVQLARTTGARVIATHRDTDGAAYLTGLGAHETIDATAGLATAMRLHMTRVATV
ncbi:alcohol dehydrogenase catalytic domain-containing protein [Streptomyces sp. NPDC101234]|uniref:alcohol dehydrogenase catalytic domain-containing protein n=1 Tax=Streptomyces sp. NPDC101234 TaxID=3366138 RepID=UPI0038035000